MERVARGASRTYVVNHGDAGEPAETVFRREFLMLIAVAVFLALLAPPSAQEQLVDVPPVRAVTQVVSPVAAVLGAVPNAAGQTTPGTAVPQVPERWAFLYEFGASDEAQASFPFESISIERSGCFGSCPVYSATLRADGSASYFGGRHAPRSGRLSGKVHFLAFARLAFFVEKSGFTEMRDRYAAGWTDDETVIVTVTWRDGRRKRVSDYGRFGPPDLWILQQAIDAVVDRVTWGGSD